jgi:hypothetical protein
MGTRIAVLLVLLMAGCGGARPMRSKHASYVPPEEDDVADDADAPHHAAPPPAHLPRPVDEAADYEEAPRAARHRGRSGGCTHHDTIACVFDGHRICTTDAEGCRVCSCAQPRDQPEEWSNPTRPAWP